MGMGFPHIAAQRCIDMEGIHAEEGGDWMRESGRWIAGMLAAAGLRLFAAGGGFDGLLARTQTGPEEGRMKNVTLVSAPRPTAVPAARETARPAALQALRVSPMEATAADRKSVV